MSASSQNQINGDVVPRPFRTVEDFLSNTSRFKIIESTLREGEQFANAFFDTSKPLCHD
jgi:hypothetical protein